MRVPSSVAIMQVFQFYRNYASGIFLYNYLGGYLVDIFVAFMQVKVSAGNMWVTMFFEIMHVGVSVSVMRVVFSAVHYAHDYFYYNYAGDCFCCSYV